MALLEARFPDLPARDIIFETLQKAKFDVTGMQGVGGHCLSCSRRETGAARGWGEAGGQGMSEETEARGPGCSPLLDSSFVTYGIT